MSGPACPLAFQTDGVLLDSTRANPPNDRAPAPPPLPAVTAIIRKRDDAPVVGVQVAGGAAFAVPRADVEAMDLRVGTRMTGEMMSAVAAANQYVKLHRLAMRWINRTALTRAVIEKKAADKGFAHQVVARLLAEFTKVGLIDDPKVARDAAEYEVYRAPAGRQLLVDKLQRRGVDELTAEAAADHALSERDIESDAVALARAKAGRLRPAGKDPGALVRARRRLFGILARRGFEAETCERAVTAVLGPPPEELGGAEAEWADDGPPEGGEE